MSAAEDADIVPVGELPSIVAERLAAGKPVRRTLAGGGRLHIDRALPFLAVYRPREGHDDAGTRDFVRTQASYLVAPVGRDADTTTLAEGVVEVLAKLCGACVVLELWSGDDGTCPFRIHATATDRIATTIDALAAALRQMNLPVGDSTVEIRTADAPCPPGLPALLDPVRATKAGVLAIGLEVPPRYRPATQPRTATAEVTASIVYPMVAQAMARELAHAMQRCFYEFARVQTPTVPTHFHAMGRRYIVRAVRDADRSLAEIGSTFDFLLAVTPVNVDAAWTEFCESNHKSMPALRYRMLEVDPAIGKRQLYDLPLDRLEDPVLAALLHDKRQELDRQLSMLEDRDTPRFLYGSLQLYPPVDDELLAVAEAILAAKPGKREDDGVRLGAEAVAERARDEMERYHAKHAGFCSRVCVRDDIAALMVSHGDLLIPTTIQISPNRVDALLQHEVGTHVVTYTNGFAQPLRVLAAGLAGYEALQEGLALIAEFVAGGMDADRLRVIAARVIAVRRLVEGAALPAVVEELVAHGFTPRGAFGTAVRVFRGGGLSKDAIYLRGLLELLAYLREGHELDPMLVGKIAFDQVPFIEELLRRGVLHPPALIPHWLQAEAAAPRLAKLRAGLTPLDLLEAA